MDKSGVISGRKQEISLLEELYKSEKAEFVAVYGRRRVGKTHLIRGVFEMKKRSTFFHVTGIQNSDAETQLKEFATRLDDTFYGGKQVIRGIENWMEAFRVLTVSISQRPKNEKIVIFFDELPWMATPRSRLLTALELYWNRHWSFDSRIKLVICGSATSWIIENIINNRGGLHNRVTRTMRIQPFTLYEVSTYLKSKKITLNNRQILDLYIVIGGIPLYWSFVRKGYSSSQNIDQICFQSHGPLTQEFNRLFSSLFEDPKPYIDLIRVLAKHRYGLRQSELLVQAKMSKGGNAVRRLNHLEEAGFIISLMPYGNKEKGLYYLIDDEYCLFYLHWIEPKLRTIAKKSMKEGYWQAQATRAAWRSWAEYAFEAVCYKHIDQIRNALKIDPGAESGTWKHTPRKRAADQGAQIDLLFDRHDQAITLCEIKHSEKPFAIDKKYAQELLKKMDVFRKKTKTHKQLFLAMITAEGLKPTMYSKEIVTNTVTLNALFQK